MNWSVGNFSLSGPWKILYKVVCKKMYEVVREKIIMKWSVKIFMTWSETKKWCICASLIRPKTGTMEERDNTRKEGENYKPFRSFCRKNKDFSWSFAKNRGIQFGIMRCILCSLLFRKNFPTGGNLRIGRARPSREFLLYRMLTTCCSYCYLNDSKWKEHAQRGNLFHTISSSYCLTIFYCFLNETSVRSAENDGIVFLIICSLLFILRCRQNRLSLVATTQQQLLQQH